MKLPNLHKFYTVNVFLYLIIVEFIAFWTIFILNNLRVFPICIKMLYAFEFNYLFYIIFFPISGLFVLFEFILRKNQKIANVNQVNLSTNEKKLIYMIIIIFFIIMFFIFYIYGAPPTPEQLRYD